MKRRSLLSKRPLRPIGPKKCALAKKENTEPIAKQDVHKPPSNPFSKATPILDKIKPSKATPKISTQKQTANIQKQAHGKKDKKDVAFVKVLGGNPTEFFKKLIVSTINNAYNPKQIVYCYGKSNLTMLRNYGVERLGWKLVLAHDSNTYYGSVFGCKTHAFYKASTDMGKPILYTDWDCQPYKPIDNEFFTNLNRNSSGLKLCNVAYFVRRRQPSTWCDWRPSMQNIMPNSGFVYFTDSRFVKLAHELYLDESNFKYRVADEPFLAMAIDKLVGGGACLDKQKLWEQYECLVCQTPRRTIFRREYDKLKHIMYYTHFMSSRIQKENMIIEKWYNNGEIRKT